MLISLKQFFLALEVADLLVDPSTNHIQNFMRFVGRKLSPGRLLRIPHINIILCTNFRTSFKKSAEMRKVCFAMQLEPALDKSH
jgi:hypothetical protein